VTLNQYAVIVKYLGQEVRLILISIILYNMRPLTFDLGAVRSKLNYNTWNGKYTRWAKSWYTLFSIQYSIDGSSQILTFSLTFKFSCLTPFNLTIPLKKIIITFGPPCLMCRMNF
jgi:hypothetical protein